MGALQKRIAESYARVRRMWRFRKMEYAVNTLGVMAVLVTVMLQVEDLAGTIEKATSDRTGDGNRWAN